jgi:glycerol-3-phosphate acyltransferase PlsY
MLSDNAALHATAAGVAVAGHVWPLWAGFRGGRGIATGVGVAGALEPLAGLAGIAIFAPVVALTRYVSLGSLCSVVGVVVFFGIMFAMGREPLPYFLFSLAAGVLIVVMHRDNVQRLLTRTERRLGERTASRE